MSLQPPYFGDEIAQRTSGSFSFERVELSEVFVTARSTKTVLNTAERVQRIMRVDHDDLRDIKLIVPWELLEQAKIYNAVPSGQEDQYQTMLLREYRAFCREEDDS